MSDEPETPGFPASYLGDGLYASFDGFNIWLSAERDGMTHRVALEPSTWNSLQDYVIELDKLRIAAHAKAEKQHVLDNHAPDGETPTAKTVDGVRYVTSDEAIKGTEADPDSKRAVDGD